MMTPEEFLDPKTWEKLSDLVIDPDRPVRLLNNVERGFSKHQFDTYGYCHLPGNIAPYSASISNLEKEGLLPVCMFVYERPWRLLLEYAPIVRELLGAQDIAALPSFWAWSVKEKEAGFKPHRDRGRKSLHNSKPVSLTVWLSFVDVMPGMSTIALLPKNADLTYGTPKENETLDWDTLLPEIHTIYPRQGDCLMWDQAVLHWGTRAVPNADTRYSIALEFQSMNSSMFDHPLLLVNKIPTFGLRMVLIAKQILQYQHLATVTPEWVELAKKVIEKVKRDTMPLTDTLGPTRSEHVMAKPIEPTPTLQGEDAKRVLRSLSNVASPEEVARRREAARKFAEVVTASHHPSTGEKP